MNNTKPGQTDCMTQYNIFLCSSISEFSEERRELSAYVYELSRKTRLQSNLLIHLIKCEDEDEAIVLGGKQQQYNEDIRKADLVIFLFGKRAGEYTLGELDVAAERIAEGKKDQILVLCETDPYKTDGEGFCALKKKLDAYRLHWHPLTSLDRIERMLTEAMFFHFFKAVNP